jgi:hypothetical protein
LGASPCSCKTAFFYKAVHDPYLLFSRVAELLSWKLRVTAKAETAISEV